VGEGERGSVGTGLSVNDRGRRWRNFNPFISAIVNVVNHLIWEMKLRKELQPVSVFYEDVKYAVHKLLKVKYLREAKQNDIFFVCRHTFDPP
jgi:hypothetical protein